MLSANAQAASLALMEGRMERPTRKVLSGSGGWEPCAQASAQLRGKDTIMASSY